MAGKNTAAFGIYPSRAAVEEAVEHLRSAGFRSTDISVRMATRSERWIRRTTFLIVAASSSSA